MIKIVSTKIYDKVVDAAKQIYLYNQYKKVAPHNYHYLFFPFGIHLIHSSYWDDINKGEIEADYLQIYYPNNGVVLDNFGIERFFPPVYFIEEEYLLAVHITQELNIGVVNKSKVSNFCKDYSIAKCLNVNFGEKDVEYEKISI